MRHIRLTRSNWLNDHVGGDAGNVILLSDEMARDAVEVHRIAVYAPEFDGARYHQEPVMTVEVPQFVGPEKTAQRIAELTASEVVTIEPTVTEADWGLEDNDQPYPGAVEAEPELKAPWSNAPKADWVAWAIHKGCDPEQAAGMTKNQLLSRYGERL